jgi:Tol biopolymer transport system component
MVFAGDAVQPAWSPSGHRIAFWRSKGGRRDVVTIPAGGGEPVAVTSDAYMDWDPVWSPDGHQLNFVSDRSGNMNLWRVAIDEETGAVKGKPEAVTLPSPHVGHIGFSRDGRKVLFASSTFRSTLNPRGVRRAVGHGHGDCGGDHTALQPGGAPAPVA